MQKVLIDDDVPFVNNGTAKRQVIVIETKPKVNIQPKIQTATKTENPDNYDRGNDKNNDYSSLYWWAVGGYFGGKILKFW